MSEGLHATVRIYAAPLFMTWWHIQMPTGPGAQTHGDPLLGSVSSSAIHWFPGHRRDRPSSRSSAEAEYRGVANVAAECCWLRNLLRELHVPMHKASIIFCDNVLAVYLAQNPVHHPRTKHVELDFHFVREKTALGQLRVLCVPTKHQLRAFPRRSLKTSETVCASVCHACYCCTYIKTHTR